MKMTLKNIAKDDIRKVGNTYNALFMIEELNNRIVRPLVEINNNKYIRMWRNCFDEEGQFSRARFNQHLDEFENWEGSFSLIWLDLKSVNRQEDRTAIINCLVRLIKNSSQINQHIDFILKDFFFYPLHLHFSDMNALIFANMLLFKHFGMRSHDFEITPEEVLISREEKNTQLIARLSSLIESQWGDRFVEKVKTIKSNLHLSLEPQQDKPAQLPSENLIKLLREVFIFLTLVGGRSAYKVVRDTVEEFAKPDSVFYTSRNSRDHLKNLMRFFQLSMRCLILLGDEDDIDVLKPIPIREKEFMSLKGLMNTNLALHQKMVWNMVTVAQEGMGILGKKGKNYNMADFNNDDMEDALKKTFILD
ncbi:MAG: hypothetical protein Q7U02_05275 [Desulfosalsimonadaceae bacterium]|nr:hypothetical protein [Desulfosalsimonadaceae bacterium]